MQDRAAEIIKRQQELENKRACFVEQWRQIDEVLAPAPDRFNGAQPQDGQTATEKVFDSTATLALDKFTSAFNSSLTPQNQQWHKLVTTIKGITEDHEVQKYLDEVTDILFTARYRPASNFANQLYESYYSLGKYGTQCIYIGDDLGEGLIYRSIHISEFFIADNAVGIVDTVYRKFQYTANQAVNAFGYKNLPDIIRAKIDNGRPDDKFWFIHAVEPNTEHNPRYKNKESMKFRSCYICSETKEIISEGGFRTFPYAVSRYKTLPNEVYGRSPAMDVLPDIKMLQEMSKAVIRGTQYQVDPVLLAAEDELLSTFDMAPGAINFGGLDEQGNQRIIPLQTGANIQLGEDQLERKRQLINEAFLVLLFQIMVDTPQMTATEVMTRQQEKAAMLAPILGRQLSELLGPMIEREIDILAASGAFPPMPPLLQEYLGEIKIEYSGQFSKAQKADEGLGIMNLLQAVAGMAQFAPEVLKVINYDEAVRSLADVYGAPAKILLSKEEVAAANQASADQAKLQNLLQAGPLVAQTARDLAQAQKIAGQPEVL